MLYCTSEYTYYGNNSHAQHRTPGLTKEEGQEGKATVV